MRGVMAEVPESLLAERRRIGIDRRDEMWGGVLHMVPPTSSLHSIRSGDLCAALRRVAAPEQRVLIEPGLFDPAVETMTSYRVPDLGVADVSVVSERGIEGTADLLVEVLSPNDDSYEKLGFYRVMGVGELLYVEQRAARFEVRRPEGAGWAVVAPDEEGWVALSSVPLRLRSHQGELEVVDL